jgi:integrase
LVTVYMTGWRIGALLALRQDDVDLDAGAAFTRAEDNKGRRDQRITLHPVVAEHLRKLTCFIPCFFPWNKDRRELLGEFWRIQEAGVVKPAGPKECSTTCAGPSPR